MPAEKSHRFKGQHDAKKEQYGQIYVEKFTSASENLFVVNLLYQRLGAIFMSRYQLF